MAIPAHFEDKPGNTTGRRAARRQLRLEASALTLQSQPAQVLIHNVSTSGLLIESQATLRSTESFDVLLPEVGPTTAFVVWSSANLYGCRFAEPLSTRALNALQLRSDPEPPGKAQSVPDSNPEPQSDPAPVPPSQLETLPVRIARLRKQQGLTLDMLAELVGVSKPTVWAWEQGKARPTSERLAALAAQLGVDEADLRTGRDSDALGQAIARAREQVAVAYGVDPSRIKVIIEM